MSRPADVCMQNVSFLFMEFAAFLGASAGPAMASRLMESFSPWAPVLLGSIGVLIGLIFLVFIPEALSPPRRSSNHENAQHSTFNLHLLQSFHLLKDSIVLTLLTFLVCMPETMITSQFFAQYVSKRFGWSLTKAGYRLTGYSIIHMVILLVVLLLVSSCCYDGNTRLSKTSGSPAGQPCSLPLECFSCLHHK